MKKKVVEIPERTIALLDKVEFQTRIITARLTDKEVIALENQEQKVKMEMRKFRDMTIKFGNSVRTRF